MGIHTVRLAYEKQDPVHRIHSLKLAAEFFGQSKLSSNKQFSSYINEHTKIIKKMSENLEFKKGKITHKWEIPLAQNVQNLFNRNDLKSAMRLAKEIKVSKRRLNIYLIKFYCRQRNWKEL